MSHLVVVHRQGAKISNMAIRAAVNEHYMYALNHLATHRNESYQTYWSCGEILAHVHREANSDYISVNVCKIILGGGARVEGEDFDYLKVSQDDYTG